MMFCLKKKWIAQLIQPGTSLGGARPKAGVLDEKGNLCIAKFPSRKDDYDAGLWEHFSHLLAQKAGILVAQTRVLGGLENITHSCLNALTELQKLRESILRHPCLC